MGTDQNVIASPDLVRQLQDMGYTHHEASYALVVAKNNLVSAMDWIIENKHRIPPAGQPGLPSNSSLP